MREERKIDLEKFCKKWNLNLTLEWLDEVLTHPSYRKEVTNGENLRNFEYWETLGDAILDLIVLDILIFDFDIINEGLLTTIRANLVNNDALIKLEEILNLKSLLKTEIHYELQNKDQADIVEAFFGLLYKNYNIEFCKEFFNQLNKEFLLEVVKQSQDVFNEEGRIAINPKNTLQEYCQKNSLIVPEYILISETGEPHDKFFEFKCKIYTLEGELVTAIGYGSNKKTAQKDAALKICKKLGL